MNILFVPTKDPRLTNGGNEQRTNLLWNSLKRYGRVYTFLLDESLGTNTELIAGEHPIFRFHPIYKKKSIWYIVNVIFERLSIFSIFKCKTTKVPNPADVFAGVRFDIVVARYIYSLCYSDYWRLAPLLIDIDDHPDQVFATVRSEHLPLVFRRLGKWLTSWQTDRIVSKSFGGWLANEEQVELCGFNYFYLPNIPQKPSSNYAVNNQDRTNLFTVGAMGYKPNRDGVNFFLKEVWPEFHNLYPNVIYYIVGKGARDEDKANWQKVDGVEYLGFVDNIEILYQNVLATVVPIYSGGGTCIKTLESMSHSRICLSTKFGARGLPIEVMEKKEGILIFEDSKSFIEAYELISNSEYRECKEKLGQEVVSNYFSSDSFNRAVDELVKNFID